MRERTRLTAELCSHLVEVIEVDVCIAESVDEIAGTEIRDLCHHHGEESVGGDVEGDSEEGIGATLVELAREASACDIELEESVAGGEVHIVEVGHVPGRHDDAP